MSIQDDKVRTDVAGIIVQQLRSCPSFVDTPGFYPFAGGPGPEQQLNRHLRLHYLCWLLYPFARRQGDVPRRCWPLPSTLQVQTISFHSTLVCVQRLRLGQRASAKFPCYRRGLLEQLWCCCHCRSVGGAPHTLHVYADKSASATLYTSSMVLKSS